VIPFGYVAIDGNFPERREQLAGQRSGRVAANSSAGVIPE
jgi:hypothetical protein